MELTVDNVIVCVTAIVHTLFDWHQVLLEQVSFCLADSMIMLAWIFSMRHLAISALALQVRGISMDRL